MTDLPDLEQFLAIISSHTGLVIPEQEHARLGQVLTERMKHCRCRSSHEYFLLLESGSEVGGREWQSLVLVLTTGESYFFRDSGQFQLLEKVVMPAIIDKKSRENRELRIWSAGCSTGEEPYSLAILLDKLLPNREAWEIHLIGSDINEQSLEQARHGRYGSWSFRRSDIAGEDAYFHRKKGTELLGKEWVLEKNIRKMVTFRKINLIKDPFPEAHGVLREMDLILCRNVFIYFDTHTIREVVERFAQTLRPGGFLITGHAELSGFPPGDLQAKMYPESVVYQRQLPEEKPATKSRNPRVVTVTLDSRKPWRKPREEPKSLPVSVAPLALPNPVLTIKDVREKLKEAESLFARGSYQQAIDRAGDLTDSDAPFIPVEVRFQALFLLARSHANLGQYSQAESYCHRATQTNAFSVQPHFLLAHIFLEQGQRRQAKQHLQKALYLDARYAPTYLELAAIHHQEGDHGRARRLRETALELLAQLPMDARLETFEDWTVQELMQHVRDMIR